MNILDIIKKWVSTFRKKPDENKTMPSVNEKSGEQRRKKYCWMHNGQKTVFIEYTRYEEYVSLGYKRGRAKKNNSSQK